MSEEKTFRCGWCAKMRKHSAYAGADKYYYCSDVCQWCRAVETRRNSKARKPLQGEKKGETVFEL